MAGIGIILVMLIGVGMAIIIKYWVWYLLLGGVFTAGVLMLIAGMTRRTNARREGRKAGGALIAAGITLAAVPYFVIFVFILRGQF